MYKNYCAVAEKRTRYGITCSSFYFVFTCFCTNPRQPKKKNKKKNRKTTRKMCGIEKNYKTTTTTTTFHMQETFKWCLLFPNVCFLPFHWVSLDLMALLHFFFSDVKLFLAQLFTPKALIVNCCWLLSSSLGRRTMLMLGKRKIPPHFLWQIIMQIVAAVAFQSLILFPFNFNFLSFTHSQVANIVVVVVVTTKQRKEIYDILWRAI